ncbi:MAG: hypothetical protein VYA34_06505 [Myxococcota bacterium]|nr:hypothetical protein [Myxococcota bacterium]
MEMYVLGLSLRYLDDIFSAQRPALLYGRISLFVVLMAKTCGGIFCFIFSWKMDKEREQAALKNARGDNEHG